MKVFLLFVLTIILSSCSGLNTAEQKVVSGAAVGGMFGCAPGTAIGALAGYIYSEIDDEKE